MRGRGWQRYVGPAAFLLAATIAILLVRSGLEAGRTPARTPVSVPTVPPRHRATTTTKARTTTAKAKPVGRRFWTVQAGDTYGVISSKSGVPARMIKKLNPNVSSTSLFIGERIRLR